MSDSISRQAAIRWVKTECNPYGKPTLDFESGKKVIEHLEQMPSADRPQGEWIGYEIPSECSVCGHHWDEYVFGQELWHDGSVPNYCPNCGAKMKGADDD